MVLHGHHARIAKHKLADARVPTAVVVVVHGVGIDGRVALGRDHLRRVRSGSQAAFGDASAVIEPAAASAGRLRPVVSVLPNQSRVEVLLAHESRMRHAVGHGTDGHARTNLYLVRRHVVAAAVGLTAVHRSAGGADNRAAEMDVSIVAGLVGQGRPGAAGHRGHGHWNVVDGLGAPTRRGTDTTGRADISVGTHFNVDRAVGPAGAVVGRDPQLQPAVGVLLFHHGPQQADPAIHGFARYAHAVRHHLFAVAVRIQQDRGTQLLKVVGAVGSAG